MNPSSKNKECASILWGLRRSLWHHDTRMALSCLAATEHCDRGDAFNRRWERIRRSKDLDEAGYAAWTEWWSFFEFVLQ